MVAESQKQAFSQRLHRALDYAHIPKKRGRPAAVAKLFGVSREAARKWLDAESIPDTKRIPQIARRLQVRAEWLLSGVGPMEQTTMNDDLQQLIDTYNAMTETQRQELLALARQLRDNRPSIGGKAPAFEPPQTSTDRSHKDE